MLKLNKFLFRIESNDTHHLISKVPCCFYTTDFKTFQKIQTPKKHNQPQQKQPQPQQQQQQQQHRQEAKTNLKSGPAATSNIPSLRDYLKQTVLDETSCRTFESVLKKRRQQAANSILFRLDSNHDKSLVANNLLLDCRKIGSEVSSAHLLGKDKFYNLLIEFKSQKCVQNLLSNYSCNVPNGFDHQITSNSSILNYRLSKHGSAPTPENNFIIDATADTFNYRNSLKKLVKLKDLNAQLQLFYDSNRINDSSQRVRYFIASLIEKCFSNLFNNCICLPFGSSVNNFGSLSSDLDLTFSIDGTKNPLIKNELVQLDPLNGNFHYIRKDCSAHAFRNNFFNLIQHYLDLLLPKFRTIKYIPFAKVPIIKFEFEYGEKLNCDLSLSNFKSAYLMSKLFWSLSRANVKVAPLVFAVRQWALVNGIHDSNVPNDSISNFQLTNLVLFFLKNKLFKATDTLIRFNTTSLGEENGVNDAHLINTVVEDDFELLRLENNSSLGELFREFFEFYASFDLGKNVVTLAREPQLLSLKERALRIENSFFPNVNAAGNVSKFKLEHFQLSCKTAAEILNYEKDLVKFMDIFIKEFCRISAESVHKEINQKVLNSAAQKLQLEVNELKELIEFLTWILIENARVNLNEKEFNESFTLAGLKQELIDEIHLNCAANKEMLHAYLEKLRLDTFEFKNLSWRVDAKLASRNLRKTCESEIVLKLDLENDLKQSQTHILQTDPVNLMRLTNCLEEALNEIKTTYCRRVVKNIV